MNYKRTAVATDGAFRAHSDDGNMYIEGYFAVFNSRYQLWDDAFETIDPGAFDGETEGDVRALSNHNTGIVLGRTTAGTLVLRVDEKGLRGRITVNQEDQEAMNLYARVKRGDVTQCSFGFDILEQDVKYQDGAPTEWHIRKVKLYEVSVVTFPAYEDTSVEARRADYNTMRKMQREEWRKGMRKRLKGEKDGIKNSDA